MARLVRAVPCSHQGCAKTTRDSSLRCIHHRRSSRPDRADLYRDDNTYVPSLRVLGAARASREPDHEQGWVAGAMAAAKTAMAQRSRVLQPAPLSPVVVTHVPAHLELPDGAVRDEDGSVSIPEDPTTGARYGEALDLSNAAWYASASALNIHAGAGEVYDDRAEILASLSLLDVEAQTSWSDIAGTLSVRIDDGTTTTRVRLETTAVFQDGRARIKTIATDEQGQVLTAAGAAAMTQACEAADLIETYMVRNAGRVHLPLGWTNANP